jgi:excisionase family DNA binding protein
MKTVKSEHTDVRFSEEDVLLAADVVRWLRVGLSTVYEWAKAGKIPCLRINGLLRFSRKEIETWLQAQTVAASDPTEKSLERQGKEPSISPDLLQRTAREVLRSTQEAARHGLPRNRRVGKQ